MGIISIDPALQQSDAIADVLDALITDSTVSLPVPNLLSIIEAKARPGLNSDLITQNIISRFSEIGIPNGVLENSHINVMEGLIQIICDEIVDAIQNTMRVDVAVDIGMQVIAAGASPAGPVTTTGANPAPHTATGIAS